MVHILYSRVVAEQNMVVMHVWTDTQYVLAKHAKLRHANVRGSMCLRSGLSAIGKVWALGGGWFIVGIMCFTRECLRRSRAMVCPHCKDQVVSLWCVHMPSSIRPSWSTS